MSELNDRRATATEARAPAVDHYECVKCHKTFPSKAALTMHRMRMHTRRGKEGWKLAIDRSHRARSKLAKQKRESYERRKEEFLRRGLNARGKPFRSRLSEAMRESWAQRKRSTPMTAEERRAEMRERNRRMRERYIAQGLTSKGTPRKRGGFHPKEEFPSRRRLAMRAYQQRAYWRKREKLGFPVPADKQHLLMENGARPNEKLGGEDTLSQVLAEELQCAFTD